MSERDSTPTADAVSDVGAQQQSNSAGGAAAPARTQKQAAKDAKKQARAQRAGQPNTNIWRSRLSWRITLTVFMTITAVQVAVLVFTVRNFQQERLYEIRQQAQAVLRTAFDRSIRDQSTVPISEDTAAKLINYTLVDGFKIYNLELAQLRSFGQETTLALDPMNRDNERQRQYYSPDSAHYEVVFAPVDIAAPYNVVARMDAREVPPKVASYREQSAIVLVLLSAFVTTVMMLALGTWLLEPLMLLRRNLVAAKRSPETPDVDDGHVDPRDEIGGAILFANDLIRQNARNLRQMREQAADKIHRLAYYDNLTSLPNRTLFLSQVEEEMNKLEEAGMKKRLAVAAIDLDHFKDINDTMGHQIGDKLLQAVGERLQNSIPKSALVARSGEDEFAIAMPISAQQDDSNRVAEIIFGALDAPFNVLNENFQIRASIGVAKFPDDATEPTALLKNADIALNRAKEDGRDMVRYYSEDFDKAVQYRFQMLRDLRSALDEDQLTLFYQPQLNLKTGEVIGAEALLRWWRPDNSKEGGSFVSPAEFIPVAEQSGLIVPIGSWVMKTAALANKKLIDMGFKTHRIAVNLSAAQFHQSDIVDYVEKLLKYTKMDPHMLELEVTESIFMEDVNSTIETLRRLHALGVELAIDDFGTGYSSLSYLRQFPIDRLKIDQSFIRNALINPDDAAITRTIIRLGHSLGLKVIAEGVETVEHQQFLVEHGCDEVQGYRYSRPVPEEDLIRLLQNYNGELSSWDDRDTWNPPQPRSHPAGNNAVQAAAVKAAENIGPEIDKRAPDPHIPVARPIEDVHPDAVASARPRGGKTGAANPPPTPAPAVVHDLPDARPISEAYPESVARPGKSKDDAEPKPVKKPEKEAKAKANAQPQPQPQPEPQPEPQQQPETGADHEAAAAAADFSLAEDEEHSADTPAKAAGPDEQVIDHPDEQDATPETGLALAGDGTDDDSATAAAETAETPEDAPFEDSGLALAEHEEHSAIAKAAAPDEQVIEDAGDGDDAGLALAGDDEAPIAAKPVKDGDESANEAEEEDFAEAAGLSLDEDKEFTARPDDREAGQDDDSEDTGFDTGGLSLEEEEDSKPAAKDEDADSGGDASEAGDESGETAISDSGGSTKSADAGLTLSAMNFSAAEAETEDEGGEEDETKDPA